MAEILIWVLLYLPPTQFPVYVSAWRDYHSCELKAEKLTEYFAQDKDKYPEGKMFICVKEALRDTAKEDK